jgi:hypothetical protein
VRDPDAPSVPKSDAERAAYGARLVADAVARLDARFEPDGDPDLRTDANRQPTHPDARPAGLAVADDRPVRDPDHVPNIVVHPGDRLTVAVDPDGHAAVRLTDRAGRCFAVLECDYRRAGEYRVCAIRFAGDAAAGRRGLLPVRPEPDAPRDALTAGPSAGATAAGHAHAHEHAGEWHRHAHQHDASERTAVTAGHSRVPHDHAHGGAE